MCWRLDFEQFRAECFCGGGWHRTCKLKHIGLQIINHVNPTYIAINSLHGCRISYLQCEPSAAFRDAVGTEQEIHLLMHVYVRVCVCARV